MNDLSTLLYWADVLPSISWWACIVMFIATLVLGLFTFLGFTGFFGDERKYNDGVNGVHRCYHWEDLAYASDFAPRCRKLLIPTLLVFFLWGGSFFVPTKETFYLIAASEMGEEAFKTPEFAKLRKVVNNYLDAQLNEVENTDEDN